MTGAVGRRGVLRAGALLGAVALVSDCSSRQDVRPSATASADPDVRVAAAGPLTLSVWDQNTDVGINEAQVALNAAFQQRYPNVTVQRTTTSFSALKAELPAALRGDRAPDVVQANQGYPDMGAFVRDGLLVPLTDYDASYGWSYRYPHDLLQLNSFSDDGRTWREGLLYGVPQTGELVGLYCNTAAARRLGIAVPSTPASLSPAWLTAALEAVAAAGGTPLAFGNAEGTGAIAVYGLLLAALLGGPAGEALVGGSAGAWTDDRPVAAARVVQDWVARGFVPAGSTRTGKDDASSAFAAGEAVFHIDGSWRAAEYARALGDDVSFGVLAGPDGAPCAMGGTGLAWSVTTRARNVDAAAAYVAFLTDGAAGRVLVETGCLPAVAPAGAVDTGALTGQVEAAFDEVSGGGDLVPYLDYATPTFYDTLTAALRNLFTGVVTAEVFAQTLQFDHGRFLAAR